MGQGVSKDNYLKSIESILTEKVPSDSQIWSIISSVPPDEDTIVNTLKNLKSNRPDNFAVFINKLVEQLVRVKGVNREQNTAVDFSQTNIALSYLTRILPIVFESISDGNDDFNEKVFWLNEIPLVVSQSNTTQPLSTTILQEQSTPQNQQENSNAIENKTEITNDTQVIDGEKVELEQKVKEEQKVEESKENKLSPTTSTTTTTTTYTSPKSNNVDIPLAVKLMESLLELLFLPGFTVDRSLGLQSPRSEFPNSLPSNFTWISGFGVETVPTLQTKLNWNNRLSVLQCLLSCLSEELYVPQENVATHRSKWLDWFTSQEDYHTEVLFFSLINSFCTYDPIGWGVPYNHLMFADDHEASAKLSIQIINILLSYDPFNQQHNQINHGSSSNSQQQHIITNKYIQLLKSQKKARDFKFFFNSFERIINLPMIANHTKLPNSTKRIEIHQDIFITFWRFITVNHDFLKFVIGFESSPEFIVPLMQYMDEGRKNQTTHGIIQLGTFILLVLSGERDFAISMNKSFNGKIYIDIPSCQVYSDFFINVMYRLLVDTAERLESIYECILTVLSNLSPYMKNLSMVTCVKLMKLFEFLSSPRFLFQSPHNYRYVGLLLESFNHILQYQYESNTRLVYAILRCQNQFSKLAYLKITPITPNKLQHLPQPSPGSNPNESLEKLTKLSISSPIVQNENTTDTTTTTTTTTSINDNQQHGEVIKGQPNPTSEYPTHIKTVSTTTPVDQSPSSEGQSGKSTNTITTTMNTQFIPTDEWLQETKKHLPLENILRVITHLSPQIQGLCTNSGNDEQKIMEYLKMSTIVGLFQSSATIFTRKYHQNAVIKAWFSAYMWCIIYLETHSPPIFMKTNIKLFQIKK